MQKTMLILVAMVVFFLYAANTSAVERELAGKVTDKVCEISILRYGYYIPKNKSEYPPALVFFFHGFMGNNVEVYMVRPPGFEPGSQASEARTLSVEL